MTGESVGSDNGEDAKETGSSLVGSAAAGGESGDFQAPSQEELLSPAKAQGGLLSRSLSKTLNKVGSLRNAAKEAAKMAKAARPMLETDRVSEPLVALYLGCGPSPAPCEANLLTNSPHSCCCFRFPVGERRRGR